jgi:predicted MFS family arabinose efflux permease
MKRIITLYRNAYSGLSPSNWLLAVVLLINRSGTMVMPFMTLYMTESKGETISRAGFVMTLFGAGSICGALIGGRLTDRFGFYYIQLVALFGGGIMFFILGQAESYAAICICAFLLSMINESFRPANATAVAHYSSDRNRTRSYSLNRLAINLGWAFGGALGGFIASKSYALLFIIDGTTNIAAAACLWMFLSPAKNPNTARKSETTESPKKSVYMDKPYLFFIVLSTLFAYCFFQSFTTVPVYYKKVLHLTEAFIGVTMMANGLIISVIEMVIVHNLEGRRNPLHYIFIGTLLVGLAFMTLNLLPWPHAVALISVFILTFGEIYAMPFMNTYWSGRPTPATRGQYAALYTVSWSVGQILGPGTGARIADSFGFATLWWFVGGLAVATAFGFLWMLARERSATAIIPYSE